MANMEPLKSSLQNALNREGYSFQQAVIKAAEDLFSKGKSPWRLPTSEFPVGSDRLPTRIDVILQHRRMSLWLICECKRVNPAFADWCFMRAPLTDRGGLANQVYAECLCWLGNDDTPLAQANPLYPSTDKIHHLAIELKSGKKGDPEGKPRGGIEEAVGQVMRGLNGLVDFLASSSRAPDLGTMNLLPVIVTTASLWSSDVDLTTANLLDGEIDLKDSNLKPMDWLWYQYPQSPGLKHTVMQAPIQSDDDLLADALYSQFVRPVAIVSAAGFEAFCGNGHLHF